MNIIIRKITIVLKVKKKRLPGNILKDKAKIMTKLKL